MAEWRCFDGSTHPVSKKFLDIVPENLNGQPFAAIEGERQFLLKASMGDPEFPALSFGLPDHLRARLRALDHVLNMNRALRFLDGRDYRSSNEMFGPEGTLCQVHGNAWHPDTCACRLVFIFDHWRREESFVAHYPHHFGVRRCDRHGHLADFQEHFSTVLRENQLKNLHGAKKGRFSAPFG